jgi:hypothetical protein
LGVAFHNPRQHANRLRNEIGGNCIRIPLCGGRDGQAIRAMFEAPREKARGAFDVLEPSMRANGSGFAGPMTGSAKQSSDHERRADCFVASLLAMTANAVRLTG